MVWQGEYTKLFIGGDWVEPASTDTLEVVSPFTEVPIARVPSATRADVDRAVAAARTAFDQGPWPRMDLSARIDVLRRLGEEYGKRRDLLASLVTDEMGCPISTSETYQATNPKLLIETFVELAPQYPFTEVRRSRVGNALVVREPVGVVAAVVPWNAPQVVTMIKLAPALLAGCTVVLKPAPETPLDSYLLADMLQAIGLPDGVVNIVPADRDVSEYLVTHPGVDKVTFTGSTAAGRRIASLCGEALRRVTLELGGKSAAVILDDADLDATVQSLRTGSLRNTGQICSLKTRILVSRNREAELLERLSAMVSTMPVGDPTNPQTEFGPLVSARQRERVEGYIDIGTAEGARLVLGGGRPKDLDRGWFVEPTIFAGVEPSMRIAQEEIFGPVLAVVPYDDEEQAVSIANDSAYGLNGSVFTSDLDHGVAVARRIRTGTVELNGSPVGFTAPMGGFKASGIGREAGIEGFDAYVELKSIGLPAALADTLSL
jgi:acyl-CoA reductase-like NAD-dependent aldehyde dehydrogenase